MESTNVKTNIHASQVSSVSSRGASINANSAKMGSRRIFTPQFKLQVLESYRNDNDCKGNQRATARKYNIHRRQIQKWLQCETSLRSSVANINHSSVKHHFHNVSVQQQLQSQPQKHAISNSCTTDQRNTANLHLDITSPESLLSAAKVPPLTCGFTASSSTKETQGIFEGSNLAAVVAAVAVAGGTIAINNTSSTSSSVTTTTAVSALRPSPVISGGRGTTVSMSHQHNYGILPFNLTHTQHHMHPQAHQPHISSYQYHKIAHSSLSYHQADKRQPSYFTSASLPINVLSSTSSSTNNYTAGNIEHIDKVNLTQLQAKNYTSFSPEILSNESGGILDSSSVNRSFVKGEVPYSTVLSFGPMDLSLHHRREMKSELITNACNLQNTKIKLSGVCTENTCNDAIDVVDLTYRKRKFFSNDFPEKLPKLSNSETSASNSNEDEDIEIEVGVEEKFPPSKPIKLFKPYLLDNCENNKNNSTINSTNKFTKNEHAGLVERNSTMIYCTNKISHSNCISCNENTFPVVLKESLISCTDNSNFLVEPRSESPRSAFSPATYIPTLSPANFLCSKGSPVSSGYESSTSSYSDSSLSSRSDTFGYGQTYSINLRMQSIYNETSYPSKNFQTWMGKDDSKLLTTNSSIALLV